MGCGRRSSGQRMALTRVMQPGATVREVPQILKRIGQVRAGTRCVHSEDRPEMPGVRTAGGARFEREMDLREPVARWLRDELGAPVVAEEIDLGWGAPDLVAAAPVGLANRLADQPLPICDPAQVWALWELTEPRAEEHLRTCTSTPWARYVSRVLVPLCDAGLIARDEDATWRLVETPSDVFPKTVAVELKLRDWRRAISQAARYRAFASATYIAMPPERLTDSVLKTAEDRGVGALAVTRSGVRCLLRSADQRPLDMRVNMLVSETMLASHLGARVGRPAGSPRGCRVPARELLARL